MGNLRFEIDDFRLKTLTPALSHPTTPRLRRTFRRERGTAVVAILWRSLR
jgi:hypothetical protein